MTPTEMLLAAETGAAQRVAPHMDEAILGLYHGTRSMPGRRMSWIVEAVLAEAGVHSRLKEPPAICFLDITG